MKDRYLGVEDHHPPQGQRSEAPGASDPVPAVESKPVPAPLSADDAVAVVREVLFGSPPPASLEHAALEVERRLREREGKADAGDAR